MQPVWYGSHPYHHVGMPGTLPEIDDDAFKATVRGIMAGLWNTEFSVNRYSSTPTAKSTLFPPPSTSWQKEEVPGIFINI